MRGFRPKWRVWQQPLAAFIQAAFGGSRLDRAPFLRGVYLTSGTQEGTPIDQLTASLARTFGLDQQRLPSLRPEQGRSYFLAKLLRQVIFGEAMLVAEPPGRGASALGPSRLGLRSDRAWGRAHRCLLWAARQGGARSDVPRSDSARRL